MWSEAGLLKGRAGQSGEGDVKMSLAGWMKEEEGAILLMLVLKMVMLRLRECREGPSDSRSLDWVMAML